MEAAGYDVRRAKYCVANQEIMVHNTPVLCQLSIDMISNCG